METKTDAERKIILQNIIQKTVIDFLCLFSECCLSNTPGSDFLTDVLYKRLKFVIPSHVFQLRHNKSTFFKFFATFIAHRSQEKLKLMRRGKELFRNGIHQYNYELFTVILEQWPPCY